MLKASINNRPWSTRLTSNAFSLSCKRVFAMIHLHHLHLAWTQKKNHQCFMQVFWGRSLLAFLPGNRAILANACSANYKTVSICHSASRESLILHRCEGKLVPMCMSSSLGDLPTWTLGWFNDEFLGNNVACGFHMYTCTGILKLKFPNTNFTYVYLFIPEACWPI